MGRVTLTDKALLAKHLALLLKSGLTLTDALAVTVESTVGRLQAILSEVLRAVQAGRPLSEALAAYPKVFSGFFINTVYTGETSGNLATNLGNISLELEKEKDLVAKIKGAMIYPLVVLGVSFVLGLALSFLVLPKIVPLFRGLSVDLPLSTRALIAFSNLMDQHGFLIFGLVIALGAFLWSLLKQSFLAPLTHWLLLHAPLTRGLSRAVNLTRLTRTLGLLLKSGLSITEALKIGERSLGNYYYRQALARAAVSVSSGARLSASLADFPKLFPALLVRMVKVGEESGQFEETLFYLADFYESELNKSSKNLSTAIEPLLLLLIGLVVAGLALAIITPIYEITGNIKR